MSEEKRSASKQLKPLRIWIPGILLVVMVVARLVPGMVEDEPGTIWMVSAFGPLLSSLLIFLWWLLLSRASWQERLVGAIGLVASFVLVIPLLDRSMQDAPITAMTIPMGIGGFALAAIVGSRMLSRKRTLIALVVCLLAAGFSLLLKNDGVWGNMAMGLDWRWKATPEEQFLASRGAQTVEGKTEIPIGVEAAVSSAEWPGFRGPHRDGTQRGTVFSTDWNTTPPQEQWRIRLGPAWSSFAVAGPYLFTQEQRGEDEAVVCYDANSGIEVWAQAVESRFFDGLGGLGPRATPTISDGSVFAQGAEGWLLRLDAATGDVVWKVNTREIASSDLPMWGFASSPLVHSGVVVVHTAGKDAKGVLAFEAGSGELKWSVPLGQMSYSSAQVVSLAGRELLAILTDQGAQFIDPDSGKTELQHAWKVQGYRALQANVIGDDRILIPTGMGNGTRLINVSSNEAGLSSTEVWTSRNMNPDFNDVVVHQGHIYGFDNRIFACVDIKDGARKWKGGRYGKGQVLLLADSDLLLIVSEKGELALLRADPSGHQELAKFQALEGKTWNHPVVVGDRLYIRNAREAACFKLPVSSPYPQTEQEQLIQQ